MKQFRNPFTESRIERNLWITVFITLCLFMLCFFSSCSTTECLTEPNKNDLKIVWCDYNTLYTVNCYGKLVEVKNVDHESYFVGDYMICKFR